MRYRKTVLRTVAGILGLLGVAAQAAPQLINFQGRLADEYGIASEGPVDLTFRLYRAETGGTPLWQETHTGVAVDDGLFNVMLNGVAGVDLGTVFNGEARWLEIQVGDERPLEPRQKITSVAYAIRAVDAAHAEDADSASHADSAETARTADTAEVALEADHAAGADFAARADSAIRADSAATADRAAEADRADLAVTAERAESAATADHAKEAARAAEAENAVAAETAGRADRATVADEAAEAQHAAVADRAVEADRAEVAGSAAQADSADTATRASLADRAVQADDVRGRSIHPGEVSIDGRGRVINNRGEWVGSKKGLEPALSGRGLTALFRVHRGQKIGCSTQDELLTAYARVDDSGHPQMGLQGPDGPVYWFDRLFFDKYWGRTNGPLPEAPDIVDEINIKVRITLTGLALHAHMYRADLIPDGGIPSQWCTARWPG